MMKAINYKFVLPLLIFMLILVHCSGTSVTPNLKLGGDVKISYFAPNNIWQGKSTRFYKDATKKQPLVIVLWTKTWKENTKERKEPMKKFAPLVTHKMLEQDMIIFTNFIVNSGFFSLPNFSEDCLENKHENSKIISISSKGKDKYYVFDYLNKEQKKIFLDVADSILGIAQSDIKLKISVSQESPVKALDRMIREKNK